AVAGAAPDGLIWLAAGETHVLLPVIHKDLRFDPVKAFVPVTQIARSSGPVLIAHPGMPVRNIAELASLAKGNASPIDVASGNRDPVIDLATALLHATIGGSLRAQLQAPGEIPLGSVIAGRSLLGFVDPLDAAAAVRAGRVRALGIAGPARVLALGNVPTLIESKLDGFDLSGWQGLWMPAGTPVALAERLQGAIVDALKRPAMRERMDELGLAPVASRSVAFAAFVEQESGRLRALAARAGFVPR
ncbi:MAG: hypothetical protein H7125_14440, partial [Proteobacteria bacterium]|nr:hypothetical protein [Burkholderiales bacterium]